MISQGGHGALGFTPPRGKRSNTCRFFRRAVSEKFFKQLLVMKNRYANLFLTVSAPGRAGFVITGNSEKRLDEAGDSGLEKQPLRNAQSCPGRQGMTAVGDASFHTAPGVPTPPGIPDHRAISLIHHSIEEAAADHRCGDFRRGGIAAAELDGHFLA